MRMSSSRATICRGHAAAGDRDDRAPAAAVGAVVVEPPGQRPAVAVDLVPGDVEALLVRQAVGGPGSGLLLAAGDDVDVGRVLGLHADDVVAGIDVVDLAGDAARQVGEQIERRLADVLDA